MTRPYNQNHHLTDEQKELGEKNIYLIKWYVKKLLEEDKIVPKEIDELSGYLEFSYCKSFIHYDTKMGYKLSTYVVNSLHSGYARYMQLKNRYNSRYINVEFGYIDDEEPLYSNKCAEPIYEEQKKHLEWNDIKWFFDKIEMTPFESQVIYFYYEMKYTLQKIGDALGYTRARIGQVIIDVINKLKKFVVKKKYVLEDFLDVC